MNIGGSGFSFFNFGGGGSRSDSFKRGRKTGQKVRGTLLKWVSQEMAWVLIEGHKLLAQLNSRPPVGAQLTFLIKQLHPNIILKEIFGASSSGVNALGLARSFESARTLFENDLRPMTSQLANMPKKECFSSFLRMLSENKTFLAKFIDATACLQEINHHMDSGTNGVLHYQPWLVPSGRRHITQVRPPRNKGETSALSETIVEFELGPIGMVRAEFLHKGQHTGYKLKLQHMDKAKDLKRYLATRKHPDLHDGTECLGISKLPQAAHGGILAELLFSRRQ